jgi:putative spermidine/putrescine transport system ATP-binding protein
MKDFSRVQVRGLVKRFGDKTALHEFSLEFNKGEFVTFLGPSGCGKSTALNCITGLLPLTEGEILIDDECIDGPSRHLPPEQRQFGMVFQNYALFPHLTVAANVAFGLKLKKLPKNVIRDKVRDALKLVHLEGYDNKYPSQMSGGEQQRLAIARCVVLEPRLLLLDEPLSNLDAKLRVEMRYELKAIHTRLGVTTIYVTHDQGEALALSDKIVVMRLGRIQQVGTPEEIYADPANLFVADFMGFKNLWSATVKSLRWDGDTGHAELSVAGTELSARVRYGEGDPRRAALKAAFERGLPVRTAVRPEDMHLGTVPGSGTLKCAVELVEYLGQSSLVSAHWSADPTVPVDFRSHAPVGPGETVTVSVAPDKILLFAGDLT